MIQTKINRHLHKCRYIYSAFWISAVLILLIYMGRDLWPFGTRSILKVDLFHQYAPYLEELRSRVLSGKSLIYSWETGLGKDFLAQTAYYAASPLNLLIFLFPEKMISEMIALLVLLKISLASSSFTYYLREHFRRNDLSILIFGLLYGFCAFVTCYYWNIMWLDTVVLFPLTALGCERLVREKRISLYYISLTLTMIVNFYLSVLVCVMITLYALVTAFERSPSDKGDHKKQTREIAAAAGRFITVSFLCAMTAMFILAPVGSALSETEVSARTFPSFLIYKNIWQLVPAHFLGARDAVLARNEDLPNVFSGILPILLLPMYYGSRTVPEREKLLRSCLLVFMLLCACIRPLDYMIHGFHFPANLPHRYTFVYSFILLSMAYRGGSEYLFPGHRQKPDNSGTVLSRIFGTAFLCIAAVLIYECFIAETVTDIDHVLSLTDIVLNLILIGVYLTVITAAVHTEKVSEKAEKIPILKKLPVTGRLLLPFLLVSIVFECGFSLYQNMYDTGSREEYISWLSDSQKALEYMNKEQKDTFFRTEFRRFVTINEGSLYHFNGFSHFSSLAPGGISAMMENLGVAATSNSYRYYDTSPLIDAVFGIRYVMSRDSDFPAADLAYKYSFTGQAGNIRIGTNNRVLPLGFMADSDIEKWQIKGSQPFDVQNDFARRAAGISQDLYTRVAPDLIQAVNMVVEEQNEEGDSFNYSLTDPYDLSVIPSVHAEFVSDRNQYITLYVDAPNAIRFVYATSKTIEDREISAGRSLIDVGFVEKGERITADFVLTRRGAFDRAYPSYGNVRIFAAGWNDRAFQECYKKLSRETLQISSFTDTQIRGSVTASRGGILMTSIPFTKGWDVFVDGAPAPKTGIGENGLLGIPLTTGTHTILLKYHSPGFVPAVICSLLGPVLFWLFQKKITGKRHRKTK